MEGKGIVVGKKAPDFVLHDHLGGEVTLSDAVQVSPVLLAFYPGDFTMICTQQLCNYRDHIDTFNEFGVQLFGISHNSSAQHAKFAQRYDFPFLLLSDPGNVIAKTYGCSSLFMLGQVTRAVFIVNTSSIILYRYVEPTTLTKRSANELGTILKDLKAHNLL